VMRNIKACDRPHFESYRPKCGKMTNIKKITIDHTIQLP